MLGRPRPRRWLLSFVAVAVLLLPAWSTPAVGSAASSGLTMTVGRDGTVDVQLETVVANGSALRYAMDGYFGPLIESLPGSNATKASLLAQINSTESNPLLAGLFGDRDGRVDSATDVSRFGSLVQNEANLVPVSTITGVFNATMDGNAASSERLTGISFSNAPGLDTSPTPIGVTATLAATYSWSGVGRGHTFVVGWNLPSLVGNLTLPAPAVNLSFDTPSAMTITSVTGLDAAHLSNDPLGWGPASASGQYVPLLGHDVVIRFGPSFPTGDALVIGAIGAAVIAGVALFLLRRRRRGARATPAPRGTENSKTGVGPSSGSG
ncbi:MAG TPA: hypothetical protein VKT21_04535 [Thermoplasmata archaeon]|nr:hypothetical protein [Thermoplasmata archaeon]